MSDNISKRDAIDNEIFYVMRKMCRYHTVSRDMFLGGTEEHACHFATNIPDGESWGECLFEKCPFVKLFAERREDAD